MKQKIHNNRGFSLVELIVVILIMGVLTVGAAISISIVYQANVKRAASNLTSMLQRARQEAISRADSTVKLRVYLDSNKNCYVDIITSEGTLKSEKICNSHVNVEMIELDEYDSPTTYRLVYSLNDTVAMPKRTECILHFKKSTGGIEETYSDIILQGAESKDIILIRETGRSFVKEN